MIVLSTTNSWAVDIGMKILVPSCLTYDLRSEGVYLMQEGRINVVYPCQATSP